MAGKQALRSVGALLIAWVSLTWWPSLAAAEDSAVFSISDDRVGPVSGMARDPAAKLYWTVNDSGNDGVAYGVTAKGKVQGTLNFRVLPTDVEAVAMNGSRLYVGDIGDKAQQRAQITVFYFDDPQANNATVTYRSWDLRYADGKHDAGTLLVSPTGQLFVVTKGAKGAVYAAPKDPKTIGMNKLTQVGSAPAHVSDGVYLPGGQQIALLTSSTVEVVDARTYAQVASAKLPTQQPESLALGLDGTSLLVGSGAKSAKVYSIAIPGAESPSPTPSASSANSDGDQEDPAPNTGQSRRGTFLALGLAGFVAVVAGVVVAVVRKP